MYLMLNWHLNFGNYERKMKYLPLFDFTSLSTRVKSLSESESIVRPFFSIVLSASNVLLAPFELVLSSILC